MTTDRDRLAALLAHHADILAARWRATDGPGSWVAASTLESHAAKLTADEETPAVRELLDSILAFEAEHPAAPAAPADRAASACEYFAALARQPETDEQRTDRLETERDHAAGNHEHCGVTCEVQFPTEQLRNFVIVKGYPGTAGMLHELLRRAREEQPLSPFYEHPACGFHWHGRDGMDIPMRDGQPVCPRCELRGAQAVTPPGPADPAERRGGVDAMARRDGHPEWPPQYENDERDYWRRADTAMAVADVEQAAEIAHLRGLLASENKRANDAIARQEIAEQAAEEAPAVLTPYCRLLARLEADRAGHLRAAGQATDGMLRDVGSSYAAALHHAAVVAVTLFEGAEAAREYAAENTKLHQGQDDDRVASAPAATDLRERVARAIDEVFDRWRDGLGDQRPEDAIRDAVLAILPAPADRAAEWRTAADMIDAEYPGPDLDRYTRYAADYLRRMAAEAQQAGEGR